MSQHETFRSQRDRDAGDDYLFGTEANRFLSQRGHLLESGHNAVCVANPERAGPSGNVP